MKSKKHLGDGIDNIFEETENNSLELEKFFSEKKYYQRILEVDIKKIFSNPLQPRKIFDQKKIEELAESIKLYGLIAPIILKKEQDKYFIIAGERRFRAVKLLKKRTIKAIVFEEKNEYIGETAIIENIQRENLNSLEEAIAYKKILEEKNLTHDQISKKFAKSRAYITNVLRILNLPQETQKLVLENKISQGHAKALLSLKDHDLIKKISKRIINEKLSVRNVENIVNGYKLQENKKLVENKKENFSYYSKKLKKLLDTKVTIRQNKKIIINFADKEDFFRILKKIGAD
ncbi:ParB/RepB/Spo0J family partition protein [symbiont of Argiope bruennichi]|uniref:ParB/RepB/Spo0J family partition protein n=1 Tax=symbiont of Argiope bruennichi TaxID=2810479 RepID=UPI003DA3CB90